MSRMRKLLRSKECAGIFYSVLVRVSNSGSELNCHGKNVGLSFGKRLIIFFLSLRSLFVKGAAFFSTIMTLKIERKTVIVSDLIINLSLISLWYVNSKSHPWSGIGCTLNSCESSFASLSTSILSPHLHLI